MYQRAGRYDQGPMKDSCCCKESAEKEGKYPRASNLLWIVYVWAIETLPLLTKFYTFDIFLHKGNFDLIFDMVMFKEGLALLKSTFSFDKLIFLSNYF